MGCGTPMKSSVIGILKGSGLTWRLRVAASNWIEAPTVWRCLPQCDPTRQRTVALKDIWFGLAALEDSASAALGPPPPIEYFASITHHCQETGTPLGSTRNLPGPIWQWTRPRRLPAGRAVAGQST